MTIRVALDTSLLVGLLDNKDTWHDAASVVRDHLQTIDADVVFFDSVLNEVVSVIARRLGEQDRSERFRVLLDQMEALVPVESITWVSSATERLYPQILALVRQKNGELNFHDALIALACRELAIEYIASFDRDFDDIDWLVRISNPEI